MLSLPSEQLFDMDKLKVFTNFTYPTEVLDVAKLFFDVEQCTEICHAHLVCKTQLTEKKFLVVTSLGQLCDNQEFVVTDDSLQNIRLQKRFTKVSVYNVLTQFTGKKQPWGSLTGIRPTKLAKQLIAEQNSFSQPFQTFFGVNQAKTQLVDLILDTQKSVPQPAPNGADLYIGIPFCASRCSYCSFSQGEIEKLKNFVQPYVDTLCAEITATLNIAVQSGFTIQNVYIGGGTPTVLDLSNLERIFKILSKLSINEFTVEAGRPDTISKEKLSLFKDFGVNRISINPQTFTQRILDLVNRRHSVGEVYQKFELARQFDFKINMDLIAGLPSETFSEFCNSVDSAVNLEPENITVHTLALKRGSLLKEQQYDQNESVVVDMVEYSHQKLLQSAYLPYYLYRQKYMRQNLENVGFCKASNACIYNIGNMEETTSILSCGSGAISKRVFENENRIERTANPKDVKTYIENIDQFICRKKELFTQR